MSRLIGGFVLSGVALLQSGPFLTVATYNDPSGTGFASLFANGERADMVKGVDLAKGRYAPDDYHHFIGVEISNSAMRIAGISSSAEVRYKNLSES